MLKTNRIKLFDELCTETRLRLEGAENSYVLNVHDFGNS